MRIAITGFVFGLSLGISGIHIYDWRYWFLGTVFAVLYWEGR